jgi:hypothetical protein
LMYGLGIERLQNARHQTNRQTSATLYIATCER